MVATLTLAILNLIQLGVIIALINRILRQAGQPMIELPRLPARSAEPPKRVAKFTVPVRS